MHFQIKSASLFLVFALGFPATSAPASNTPRPVFPLREDINRYIAQQDTSPAQKRALQQLAHAIANILAVNGADPSALLSSDYALQAAGSCLFSLYNEPVQPHAISTNLERLTVNTPPLIRQYLQYQQTMDGKVLASPHGNTCR